ncbi:MAG: type III pantothenate kinase [Pirellulales bacterium]
MSQPCWLNKKSKLKKLPTSEMGILRLCVDIGNSGLRAVRLNDTFDLTDRRAWPFHPELIRIDWQPAADPSSDRDESTVPRFSSAVQRWIPQQWEWTAELQRQLAAFWGAAERLDGAIEWFVSSVHRPALCVLQRFVEGRAGDRLIVIDRSHIDLDVDVLVPERVGVDRLLAASAAAKLVSSRPLIVIQAGSAVTVDLVEAPGVFAGGAIMPGVPMMLRLLSRSADQLPQVAAEELIELPSLPGKDTEGAMACGVSSAVVGGVRHLIDRYRTAAAIRSDEPITVVLSGGDGPRLAKHIPPPMIEVEHLVLRGLAAVAAR